MSEFPRLRKTLVKIAKEIYEKQYVASTGGNLSIRVKGKKDVILIKSSGKRLKDLTEKDFVVVDIDGNVLEGKNPSKELLMHLEIFRRRRNINAIIHAHPPFVTIFATLGETIPLLTAQAAMEIKSAPIIKYAEPGSEELAKRVAETLSDEKIRVALLERHGCITIGKNILEAFNLLDLLEETAKIALFTRIIR